MNNPFRNLLIVLFTTGLLIGFAILAVDSLASYSSTALESTSQNNIQAQAVSQLASDQMVTNEGGTNSTDLFAMASKMGVVAMIIMLVFLVQMGFVWLFRKPAQAARW